MSGGFSNGEREMQEPKMIFVVVGTQYGFDRLIQTGDDWAAKHPEFEFFAQIGVGKFKPRNMEFVDFLDPTTFKNKLGACECIVAHAGMGSILQSLENGKPVIVMPRNPDLGEVQNTHQLDTARRMRENVSIEVAMDENELAARLDTFMAETRRAVIGSSASCELISSIRRSIHEE